MGRFKEIGERAIAPSFWTVETALTDVGLRAEHIDYITFDHLHTQDLRRWFGTKGAPALFPNAQLLIMRQEWASARSLLPPQRDWYCPGGTEV